MRTSHTCFNIKLAKPVPTTPLHLVVDSRNCVFSLVSAQSPLCGSNRFSLINLISSRIALRSSSALSIRSNITFRSFLSCPFTLINMIDF